MRHLGLIALALAATTAACGREATTTTSSRTTATPLQSANGGGVAGGDAPLQPANGAVTGGPGGYSCSFVSGGQTILARFTLDGANARDDEGTTFAVLSNSPTAVVLARARDDVATPNGDVGAYLVAIDRRDLSMVQTTVGVKGDTNSRKGRCIAG